MASKDAEEDLKARVADLTQRVERLKNAGPSEASLAEMVTIMEGLVAELPGQHQLAARVSEAAASATRIVNYLNERPPDADATLREVGRMAVTIGGVGQCC